VQDQITAQQAVVDADNAAADEAAAAATAATVGTDPASLDAALADMANKPVDADVTAWAEGVLAGKIDQMATKIEAETTP